MRELCRMVLVLREGGLVDVAAPMDVKETCYDMLRDAKAVIDAAPEYGFNRANIHTGAKVVIILNENGMVDVAAPLPNRELCRSMLRDARTVVERFNEAEAPPDHVPMDMLR